MISKLIVVVLCALMLKDAAALTCKGVGSLIEGTAISCKPSYGTRDQEIKYAHSCIAEERAAAATTKVCTADDHCVEINIRAQASDNFDNQEDLFWSFSGCYKTSLDVKVCSEAEPDVDDDDNNSTSTTTAAPANLLIGCYEGTYSSTECTEGADVVTLESDDGSTVDFDIYLVGCCDENECRVQPDDQKYVCKHGVTGSDTIETFCDGECFSAVVQEDNGDETYYQGCLEDIPYEAIEGIWDGVSGCSTTYKEGDCTNINSKPSFPDFELEEVVEACLYCCTGNKCNDREEIGDFKGNEDEDDAGAGTAVLSLLTLLTTLCLTVFG